MFNGVNTLSAADVAAVTGNHGCNNDGFGMNGGWWWAWIMIMALWGRGGFGWDGNGAGAAAATQADIQRGFDNSNVMSSLRGIEQGLCSLGYDQLAQMNGINTNVSATGNNIISALNQQTIADIQSTNGLRSQLQDCCCENRAAIAQVRYDMSTDTCAITQAIKDAANANMQNCNNNYRSLEGKVNMHFELNDDVWHVFVVDPDSDLLIDRTNTRTVATTDPATYSIYLSSNLGGDLLVRVLIHELSHCILVSYNLLRYIHHMTKKRYWIEMEELICNVIANYIMEITKTYMEISEWYSRRFV